MWAQEKVATPLNRAAKPETENRGLVWLASVGWRERKTDLDW